MEARGQLNVSDAFTPEKELPVPVGEEAGWASDSVWTQWGRERFIFPCRESNPTMQV
jgi:hypothetical protein